MPFQFSELWMDWQDFESAGDVHLWQPVVGEAGTGNWSNHKAVLELFTE